MTPALAAVDDYIQSEKSGVTSDGEQLIPVAVVRDICATAQFDTFVPGAIIHQIANAASSHGIYIGCQNSILPISMSLRTKLFKILTPLFPRSCSSTAQVKAASSLHSHHIIPISMFCLVDFIPSLVSALVKTPNHQPCYRTSYTYRRILQSPSPLICPLNDRPHAPPWQVQFFDPGYLGQEQKFGHR